MGKYVAKWLEPQSRVCEVPGLDPPTQPMGQFRPLCVQRVTQVAHPKFSGCN